MNISRVLGIETSCDETSAAVVEAGRIVKSCIIATSSDTFAKSGGVIPEKAARQQLASIHPVIDQAISEAKVSPSDIDAVAVTRGPGLLGSLLVGTVTARALAALWKKPLIGVHHTLGHLSSTWLDSEEEIRFPVLTLSASGGHTELWLRTSHTQGTLLGSTRDDAAGEAFDKGANILSLPYPGGPNLALTAEGGISDAFPFPNPLSQEKTYDFSFSGLKTSLKYTVRDLKIPLNEALRDLASSYQNAICRHLLSRIALAVEEHSVAEVHVVGGVSANLRLREMLLAACEGTTIRFPARMSYCTDNAAMIASAGTFLFAELGNAVIEPFLTSASLPLSSALSVQF